MVKKFIAQYTESSITFKATIWYTLCNMMQKLAAFLVIPCLTRMLSTEDYGLYSVILSWLDIFEIFATMRIYSNGCVSGLIKNFDEQSIYISTVQITSFLTISISFLIFVVQSEEISRLIGVENKYIYLMFISYYATASIGIWSAKQRVNNQYKKMVIATLFYSVLAPIIAIFLAYHSSNKLETVIWTRILIQFIISTPVVFSNVVGKGIAWKYCVEALKFNVPLIPYYLSMVILNSSDRIMIKEIVGQSEAAIYSVAYSLSMAIFVFSGALNLSLQPWLFKKIKSASKDNVCGIINMAVLFVAFLDTALLVISPELIIVVASKKYYEAIWAMPPLIISLLVMFIYQQFLNVHFYFGKNKIVLVASVTAAAFNLFLNAVCIRLFGYVAAGYTTLISYTVVAIIYYFTMRKICSIYKLDHKLYFDTLFMIKILMSFIVFSGGIMLLYPYPMLRYTSILLILIILFFKRSKILRCMKIYEIVQKGKCVK